MAKLYKNTTNNPVLFQCQKANLHKNDLCRTLGISLHTLNKWIDSPEIMQLKHITTLAGLFGLPVEEFVYMLIRNKTQLKTKTCKDGVFYLESIRDRNK